MSKNVMIVVGMFTAAFAVWIARPATSAPAAAGAVWEYATLLRMDPIAALNLPGKNETATSMFDLYQNRGGKVGRNEFGIDELLTSIGADGWELASVTEDKGSETYYFKRRR